MRNYLLLFAFLTLISCNKDKTGVLEGYVTDESNNVFAGVEVMVDNHPLATTDAAGYYRIPDLDEGTYYIQAETTGQTVTLSSVKKVVKVKRESTERCDLVLKSNGIVLSTIDTISTVEQQKIQLSWSQSTNVNFLEYKVYRHDSPGLDQSTGTLIYVSTNISETTAFDSLEYDATMYYRVYVTSATGILQSSNILTYTTGLFPNILALEFGVTTRGYMSGGEKLWFHFPAEAGKMYKISWFDNDTYWPGNTVGSVWVTGFREDKVTTIFPKGRLIQSTGSPRVVMAQETETYFVRLEGYFPELQGTFTIRVDTLNQSDAIEVPTDSSVVSAPMNVGDVQLFYADINANTTYLSYLGQTGTANYVYVGAYGQSSLQKFYYDENPNRLEITGVPKNAQIIATDTERVYFIFTSAYWWGPSTVSMALEPI